VIVVGHGGRINEFSPDDHRINHQTSTWTRVDQFTETVSTFNHSVHERIELLFIQNCNKTTLEVVYEASNCAKHTLASQLGLDATNYYHDGFLNHLASSVDRRDAALAIMNSEKVDMFHILTLVDNQAIKRVPEKLLGLFQAILGSNFSPINKPNFRTYHYFGEQHCDALALLDYLSRVKEPLKNPSHGQWNLDAARAIG
jgi:hypothetical protein